MCRSPNSSPARAKSRPRFSNVSARLAGSKTMRTNYRIYNNCRRFKASRRRGPVLRPGPRTLQERTQPQHVGLRAPFADDLDRGWQAVAAEARRQGERGMAGEVERVLVGGPALAGDAALHAVDHDLVVGGVVRHVERGARIGRRNQEVVALEQR